MMLVLLSYNTPGSTMTNINYSYLILFSFLIKLIPFQLNTKFKDLYYVIFSEQSSESSSPPWQPVIGRRWYSILGVSYVDDPRSFTCQSLTFAQSTRKAVMYL